MEKINMDPQLKAAWIVALRSGKYRQGYGQLRSVDKTVHCCLGVLCEIKDPTQISATGYSANGYEVLSEWMTGDPKSDIFRKMYYLNDVQGLSFAEIADFIEINL